MRQIRRDNIAAEQLERQKRLELECQLENKNKKTIILHRKKLRVIHCLSILGGMIESDLDRENVDEYLYVFAEAIYNTIKSLARRIKRERNKHIFKLLGGRNEKNKS